MSLTRFHVDLGYLWEYTKGGADFPIGQNMAIYIVPTDNLGEIRIKCLDWPLPVHLPCVGWVPVQGTHFEVAARRSWGPGEFVIAASHSARAMLEDVSSLPCTYIGSPAGSGHPRGLYALDNLDKEWG